MVSGEDKGAAQWQTLDRKREEVEQLLTGLEAVLGGCGFGSLFSWPTGTVHVSVHSFVSCNAILVKVFLSTT